MKKKYEKWVSLFLESWKNLEGVGTTKLLARDVKYYENPIDDPCSTWEEVEKLWEVVPSNQKNINYNYHIVVFDQNICVVNWQMTRELNSKSQQIDGIFEISLNEEGLCTYFKQWRFVR